MSDGDSVAVEINGDRIRVRLACIDAPELAQDPVGTAARDRLKQLLPSGSVVRLRTIAEDRYGRTVAEVFYQEQNLNLQLVREGYAVVYRQFLEGCDRDAYFSVELEARQKKLGLWQSSEPVMPWNFRRGR
ncbi:thermonuclease family protein [Synechococcus elongatus]|uniref:thermonuclease family protein n=1 Tax=Synechococcus elongatus TaxID=32046 RepID=UPI0030D46059